MNKYTARLKKLENRTGELSEKINDRFIADLTLIRDYYKSLISDRRVKAIFVNDIYAQLDRIEQECLQDESLDYIQKISELTETSSLIEEAYFYKVAARMCESITSGESIPRKGTLVINQHIGDAKEYFKKRNRYDFSSFFKNIKY
jgi:hypothetical protein